MVLGCLGCSYVQSVLGEHLHPLVDHWGDLGKCLSQLRQQTSLAVWEEMWHGDWWPERCLNNWFEFPPSTEKDRNEQPQQLNFPNVKNRREAKTIQSVRTWLCSTASLSHCRLAAMFSRKAGLRAHGLGCSGSGVWGLGCLGCSGSGCLGCSGVQGVPRC